MELKKVIIAPDSFKGALTARQAADIISREVSRFFPECTVVKMPIADGGEGSLETILAAVWGTVYEERVLAPDDREISARYGITGAGTAILEAAQSSGLTRQEGLHPMSSSTYGFGQLIAAALDRGARDFVLCIGGSATTDGGCGMAAALGAGFLDSAGNSFVPCGATLINIAKIETDGLDPRLADCTFTVMCDVDNPLFGPEGAAHCYGAQKGADSAQIQALDRGLEHLSALLSERFGKDFGSLPGGGAAGGLGAGAVAFLNAGLKSGSEAILELCGFAQQLAGTDLVITGEGRLDNQSFKGKVLSGILRSAGTVPVCAICGVCTCDENLLKKHGLRVFETSAGISIGESMARPEQYLKAAAKRAMLEYAGIQEK